MALGTYAELKSAMEEWLAEDTLITARTGDFIAFLEADLNADPDFRLLQMQQVKTADLIEGDQDVTLPTGYLEMVYVTETTAPDRPPLTYVSPEQLISMEDPGFLAYYTIIGGKLRLKGDVGASQQLEMAYFEEIPALSDSNTTNWLLTKAPQLYLYGALVHAEPYLENDARAATWSGGARSIKERLVDANVNAVTTAGAMQVNMPEAVA